MRRARAFLLGLALALTGCAHYQLGTGGTPSFASLYVAPVMDKAHIPQAQVVTTSQIRDAFEKDGRVSLLDATRGADATLEVTLVGYTRQIAANRDGVFAGSNVISSVTDTGLAREFVITLTARCTLRDNRTGKALFTDRMVSVKKNAMTDNGNPEALPETNQLQSEYNTLPILARALADQLTHTVLDVW